jgi:beta-N-acetylhexosaminidase
MDLTQLVGQCFMVGFQGTSAPQYLLEWLHEGRVGGIILFARNVENPRQLAALTRSLHAAAAFPLLISIDQEGGTVARLRGGFTESPSAMALARTGSEDNARQAYAILGAEMRALGINWDYAPVLDMAYNRENPTVGTRSFGADPQVIGAYGAQAVRGLQSAGVAACAKHFPGLGNTAVDTHVALPTLSTRLEHVMSVDLLPYRAVMAEDVASIMTTHTIFADLDRDFPATLSPVVVPRLLREYLGYEGVVTTDCMEMKAIASHHSPGESAVMALLAGVDIVLFSHTREMQQAAMTAVEDALRSGRVPLQRVQQACARRQQLIERYGITPAGISHASVNLPEHRATMRDIAGQAITLLAGAAPEMTFDEGVAFVEFASLLESDVMESGGQTGIKTLLDEMHMHPSYAALKPSGAVTGLEDAISAAKRAKITIIATRNAHLIPEQAARARQIAEHAHIVVHVCLRNPYDAGLVEASTVLASYGDAQPQIEAVLQALRGDIDVRKPEGNIT